MLSVLNFLNTDSSQQEEESIAQYRRAIEIYAAPIIAINLSILGFYAITHLRNLTRQIQAYHPHRPLLTRGLLLVSDLTERLSLKTLADIASITFIGQFSVQAQIDSLRDLIRQVQDYHPDRPLLTRGLLLVSDLTERLSLKTLAEITIALVCFNAMFKLQEPLNIFVFYFFSLGLWANELYRNAMRNPHSNTTFCAWVRALDKLIRPLFENTQYVLASTINRFLAYTYLIYNTFAEQLAPSRREACQSPLPPQILGEGSFGTPILPANPFFAAARNNSVSSLKSLPREEINTAARLSDNDDELDFSDTDSHAVIFRSQPSSPFLNHASGNVDPSASPAHADTESMSDGSISLF